MPLEALQTIYRSAINWFERDFGIHSAFGTNGGKHFAWCSVATILAAILTTVFAALGFILKTLFGIELLLTNSKYELLTTILTH